MLAIAVIIAVGALIVWLEIPPLIKKKQKKELWVFSILLLFGVVSSIIVNINRDIPSPLEWITVMFKPLSDLLAAIGLIVK
ncbi:hypothetical protein MNQ98_20425 [Paenibacillus sp. N3/727]|uniref:hypothetical protein n=1 Tax=Paenibacillus sp. N3/727 TaxID=2925845 RepID=UPI001F534440|nr:hypothetical protein [Paenibacillus sp. N3/727]UNK16846.1 hypothetical protein MNQ98_20425 [Paenibacillus sp. N3/727]